MEGFVAQKLNDFETGKISRRRLIETLTLAATTVHATAATAAATVSENNNSSFCRRFTGNPPATCWPNPVFHLRAV